MAGRKINKHTTAQADRRNHSPNEDGASVIAPPISLPADFTAVLDDKLQPLLAEIKSLKSEIRSEVRSEVQSVNDNFTRLEERMQRFEDCLIKNNEIIQQLQGRVSALEADNINLQEQLNKHEMLFDEKEADSLCDNLILSGHKVPTATPDENCITVATNLLIQSTQTSLVPNHIISAYRIGKPPSANTPDNRSIKVSLKCRNKKHELLKACIKLRDSTSRGLFLNEELTKKRNNLFYLLRKYKRENRSSIILFTRDGTIFAKLSSTGTTYKIKTEQDCESFLKLCSSRYESHNVNPCSS